MKTRLIEVTAASVDAINEAAQIIKNGELVAFPTETVYGLGADGFNEAACRRLYEVKGRPNDKPLSLMVANREMIDDIAEVSPIAEELIKAFLPGPLTLILNKKSAVPNFVTAGSQTVGIRMPDNQIALALIKAADCPIAAPSANPSEAPAPTTAQAVLKYFDSKIPLILDGGACDIGFSSTIVDLTADTPAILRCGVINKSDIFKVVDYAN